MRLGIEKDKDGKNIQQVLTEFDACKEIGTNIKDGMSVFTKGKIEFSSFDSTDGKKRSIKFIPQQISLCSKDIDFEDEGFEIKADFSQQIIFMGIEKNDNIFIVKAKIVTYSSIEDTEFIIKDKNLANTFRQKLKPYNAIQVHGRIEVTENVEEVADENGWKTIRDELSNTCGVAAIPSIVIVKYNKGNSTLYLEHMFEGRELELSYAKETLKYIQELFKGKISLLTKTREHRDVEIICDENKQIVIN